MSQRKSDWVIRQPELRQHPLALVILLGNLDRLDYCEPIIIKVRMTALHYKASPDKVGRSLAWLCDNKWLELRLRDATGCGSYVLGHKMCTPRGVQSIGEPSCEVNRIAA